MWKKNKRVRDRGKKRTVDVSSQISITETVRSFQQCNYRCSIWLIKENCSFCMCRYCISIESICETANVDWRHQLSTPAFSIGLTSNYKMLHFFLIPGLCLSLWMDAQIAVPHVHVIVFVSSGKVYEVKIMMH